MSAADPNRLFRQLPSADQMLGAGGGQTLPAGALVAGGVRTAIALRHAPADATTMLAAGGGSRKIRGMVDVGLGALEAPVPGVAPQAKARARSMVGRPAPPITERHAGEVTIAWDMPDADELAARLGVRPLDAGLYDVVVAVIAGDVAPGGTLAC
jgi:hypothetical protein